MCTFLQADRYCSLFALAVSLSFTDRVVDLLGSLQWRTHVHTVSAPCQKACKVKKTHSVMLRKIFWRLFVWDKNKNICCWVWDFVEFCFKMKSEHQGQMGTAREKISKEGFEITLQHIYNSLSGRGYKTQKACDLKKKCSKKLPVLLFQFKLNYQLMRTKMCNLFCS